MSGTNYTINDHPFEQDSSISIERLVSELERQGWRVEKVEADGALLKDGAWESAGAESPREVRVTAIPPFENPLEQEEIRQEIESALPKFAQLAHQLGCQFARGEWRPSMTKLEEFLGEVDILLKAAKMVLAPEYRDEQELKITEILAELSEAIRRQSWVEVSDLLLYELEPLFEAWSTGRVEQ